MRCSRDIVALLALLGPFNLSHVQATNNRTIPPTLKIGVATAAAQIEGGWNEGGKGETIWDNMAKRNPHMISPAVACDYYHKWREDLAIVKDLGSQIFRMSIAWTRILPTGYYNGTVNQAGVDFYRNIFVELKKMNIEPLVTLYHWDLPQKLQDDLGGWMNPKIADLFADYAKVCFQLFSDYVKLWATINEPAEVCNGDYKCAKNAILAHAKAYRVYEKEFKAKYQGKVAMVINAPWVEPGSNSSADVEAAQRGLSFSYGLYGHPIVFGDWPQRVKDRVAYRSQAQGLPKPRLPEFTPEEKTLINGTHDFLALNYYVSIKAGATPEAPLNKTGFDEDQNIQCWGDPTWTKGGADWFIIWPMGVRKMLNWLKRTYGDHPMIITENGYLGKSDQLNDPLRIGYLRDHLSNCLDAIYEDKVNLIGYTAWTFMDDWEWGAVSPNFGMYKVDFNSPNRTRTKKASADFFKDVTTRRCLVKECVK